MKKILIRPPEPWYMEVHAEYLIRYLSDEFFIELAHNFHPLVPEVKNGFARNMDDFDLLYSLAPSHSEIFFTKDYLYKCVQVMCIPGEGTIDGVAGIGALTPDVERSLQGKKYHSLRFGVDLELFKPINMVREDDLFHVGMVGNLFHRRNTKNMVKAFTGIPGLRFMLFPTIAPRNQTELDVLGNNPEMIIAGGKYWPGIPNIYNRLDLILRPDNDAGYSFPLLEAVACGIPFIATNGGGVDGIEDTLSRRGAGVMLPRDRDWILANPEEHAIIFRDAVLELMKDKMKVKEMGKIGRKIVEEEYRWEQHIPAWREFFREALENAKK